MSEPSDAVLVSRVLAGQERSFEVLVQRYQDQMFAFVSYMGFDEAQAQDILQEAFVRAYRHLGRCGDPERFAGWLFRIVSNLCRTMGSKAARRRTEPLDVYSVDLACDSPLPDRIVEERLTRELVREALDAVPEDQREALVLMYLQGCSVREIEALTGASPSAVKMRLKRGRDALRALLEPLFGEVYEHG